MGDLILEILFSIIKAFLSRPERPPAVQPETRNPTAETQNESQPAPQARSASEQKAEEIWEAYRRKQEAMEAELRSKTPKW